MIEVENLSKKYGDKLAVDDLSFTVQPGIVTGFLGPNGAGKSTTMRMTAGLDRPTTGQVRVNGLDYRDACKMRANGSAQTTNRRTAQHGSVALTWETPPAIIGPRRSSRVGFSS
jgi:ABC-type Fe3+/spermidine/putrescine transport system ATPase subunit